MRVGTQREFARFGELLGICAIAIAQPVLDVFGKSPGQFAFRGASTRDILLLPILVVLVPAVVVWMPAPWPDSAPAAAAISSTWLRWPSCCTSVCSRCCTQSSMSMDS